MKENLFIVCLDPFVQFEGAQLFLETKEDTDDHLRQILLDVSTAKDLSLHEVMIRVKTPYDA